MFVIYSSIFIILLNLIIILSSFVFHSCQLSSHLLIFFLENYYSFFHYVSYIEFCSLRKIKLFLPLIVMQLTVTHFQIFVSMLLILAARLCTLNIFSWSLIPIMKLTYHRKNPSIAIELVSFSLS